MNMQSSEQCLDILILLTIVKSNRLESLIKTNNNEKFRSFKSKENIHKKEVGPYRSFGY